MLCGESCCYSAQKNYLCKIFRGIPKPFQYAARAKIENRNSSLGFVFKPKM